MSNAPSAPSNERDEATGWPDEWIESDESVEADKAFVDKLIAVNGLKDYIQSKGYRVDTEVLVTINTLLLNFQNDVEKLQRWSRYGEEVQHFSEDVEVSTVPMERSPERFRDA